jgi:hypothetical protein
MIYDIKGGMHAEGIWKQDPEANILTQERLNRGSGEGFTMRTFIVYAIYHIESGRLKLED